MHRDFGLTPGWLGRLPAGCEKREVIVERSGVEEEYVVGMHQAQRYFVELYEL